MQYRHYEMVYILRTDIGEDVVTKLRERIDGIVEAHSGKVVKFDNWGKRKLAYEIDKNPKGVYHYFQFYSDSNCVAELQRNLKIHEAVLKYMAVLVDSDIEPEALAAKLAAAEVRPPRDEEVEGPEVSESTDDSDDSDDGADTDDDD